MQTEGKKIHFDLNKKETWIALTEISHIGIFRNYNHKCLWQRLCLFPKILSPLIPYNNISPVFQQVIYVKDYISWPPVGAGYEYVTKIRPMNYKQKCHMAALWVLS